MNQNPRSAISVPNIITCFRLILIPLFVLAFFEHRYGWTIVILVLSGISDVADGYIARRFDMVTEVGKLLDPVADKLTQGAVLVCLAVRNPVLWAVFGLLACKELLMSLWGLVGIRRTGHMISAVWYGKVCTFLLYASMAVMVLAPELSQQTVNIIAGVDAAVIVATIILYSAWYVRYLRENSEKPAENTWDRSEAGVNISIVFSALILVLLLVFAAVVLVFRDEISLEAILNFTPANLWLAALVFMGLYAAKSLSFVIYVKLLYVAAGVIFPLPAALAVGLAGTLVELILPYLIGRSCGSRTADILVERWPSLRKLRIMRNSDNFWFTAFVRASGVFPADPASIYFGACRMSLRDFLGGSILGILPTLVVATVFGSYFAEPGSSGFLTAMILFIAVQVIPAIAFVIWIRRHYPAGSPAEKEVVNGESAQ